MPTPSGKLVTPSSPRLSRVALRQITWPEGQRRTFQFTDEDGEKRRIPFHRIREVYRDGQAIWERP